MPIPPYPSIALSIILQSRRDFHKDSQSLVKQIQPKPDLRNCAIIPEKGPFLVTLNHYSRPGFFILWAAVAISSALPQTPLWLMTSALTKRTGGLDQVRTHLTKIFFNRLAEVYGMVTMPPMPPAAEEAAERSLSIRRLMEKLRGRSDCVLCLAPEGMDFPGGKLGIPHAGTGKMMLQIVKSLELILPVGVFEEDGRLIINFGAPYHLDVPKDALDLDKKITQQVMEHIAALLPERMRGPYQ